MARNNFYSKDYFQKRNALPLHFAETLRLFLKETGVKKVFDVGCGTGKLVKFLNESGFKAIGCDKSAVACKISGQVKAEATNLPFKNHAFDCLTAISLIEHLTLKEAEKFIKETRRVLRPQGYFFLVTPNFLSPMRFLCRKGWFGYIDPTHTSFYSPFSLKRLLKKYQFSNFKFRFKVDPTTPADWPFSLPPLPKYFQFMINSILISSFLAYFRDSFWLLCQKRS